MKMFPFKVVNKDSKPCIEVELKEGKKTFQAEEISAMVLTKMKETAEAYLGKDIKNAVVTVPGNPSFFSKFASNLCCHTNLAKNIFEQHISMTPRGKPQKMLVPSLV